MQAMTPTTPLEAGGEMFTRAKAQSLLLPRTSLARPVSEATQIFDTDGEDESDFEESTELQDEAYQPPSPKGSFQSVCAKLNRGCRWYTCNQHDPDSTSCSPAC